MNAGWYKDPSDPTVALYWDGAQFTGDRRAIPADPEPVITAEQPATPSVVIASAPEPAYQFDQNAYADQKPSKGRTAGRILIALMTLATIVVGAYFVYALWVIAPLAPANDPLPSLQPSAAPTAAPETPTPAPTPTPEPTETLSEIPDSSTTGPGEPR